MKQMIKGCAIALGCYLFFLLAQCPAERVLPWLPLPPELKLSGVSGSIWQGEVARIDWRETTLRKVGWRLPFSSLLLMSPALQLTFKDPETLLGRAEVSQLQQPRLSEVSLQAPAEWIMAQARLPLPVSVNGKVQLELDELQLTPTRCEVAQGSVQWSGANAESQFGALRLGTAKLDLSCDKGKLVIKLKQSSDQLKVEGRGELTLPNTYSFQGTLTPGEGLPDNLAQGLNFIGQRDSQGRVRLDYAGRF
ncbi:MAG: type II secretion system protein N [Aeromonadaceae bacterium]